MRLRRRANGGPELLATFILVLIPFAVHAQAGYDSEPLPSTFVPRGYQPPPQPATYGEGYGQPRGGVYAPSGENYYRAGQHQDIGPRPPGFQPPQPVQQLRPPQQQQHHNQRPPIARQPGLAPAIQPSTFTTSPHAQKANGEPVNVVIHVFLNEKPKAGQTTHITHTTFRPGTVPPFPPDIVPPTFKHSPMPLTFTRDFDRNKNVFVEDDNADEEGPAQIVEIKAVVDSSDAAMDMKIGRAMARELDRAVPVVMGRLSNKTELNEDLRNRLETELIEEISKNLGERLEGTPDVSESELDTLIDEGFRELEGTTTTRTRPPPPPPTTTTTTTTTTSTITTTTTRRPTTTTTTTTTPRPTPPPTRPPTTSTTTQRTTTITFPQTQRPTPSPPSTTAPASPSLPSPAPSTRPSIRPPPSTTAETRPSPPPQTRPPPPPQTRPPTPAPQTEVAPTTHRIVEWWTVPPTEAPQRTQPPRTEPPRREPPSPPTATWPPMPTHDTVTTTERVPEPVRTFPTVEATRPTTRPTAPPTTRPTTAPPTQPPTPPAPPATTSEETVEPPFAHQGDHFPTEETETPLEPTSSCPDHDSSDTTKADVLFLVDSSHAMDQGAFMDALELIINTTAHFRKIGPEGVQVAVVQYADEPQLEFSLRKHNCLKPLLMDIIDTEYMQGKNMLGHALDKVTRLAFTRERGDRPDAENVLVIITGGASEDKVQAPVQLARSNGMDIFVIASIEANPEYVMELAGSMDNVFHITPQQSGLASRLADRIRKTGQGVHPFVGQRFPTFEEHASHEHMTTEKGEVKDGGEKEDQEEATTVIEHPSEVEPSTAPTHEAETEKPAVQEEGVKSGEAGTSPIHDRKIHLTCSRKAMSMEVEIEGSFDGHIYVEGQRDNANCSQKVERSKADKRIVSFHVGIEECKVATIESTSPPGFNSSAVISFVKHPKVVSLDDRAYLLECFVGRPADSTLDAHLEVHTKKKMIAETVSLALVPPACHYTIRKESPEGGEVEKADLGETVYHRWDCAGGEEAYDVYGMRVHDCYASSDVEQQFPIIDSDGCSSDHSLLLEPVYAEGALSVYAESKAFGMENADSLRFQCKVSLCTRDGDGCEGITPPVCNGNTSALLLSRRLRHNQAADTALTSAVATSVGLTTASISKASPMTVLLIAFALAALVGLIGAVRMNKCQSIRSPIPLITTPSLEDVRIVNEARASRDPRMAEFLSTFERPRYV